MKEIISTSFALFLLFNLVYAQLSPVKITLEDKRVIEGKADKVIVAKGFEGIIFHSEQDQKYIRFSELKKIVFRDQVFVKQPIKYQSLETEILIESFIGGDVVLYKGHQLNDDRLFFIGKKEDDKILKINNKGVDNFLNYYFQDCASWKKVRSNRYVYSENWFSEIALKNKNCFSSDESLVVNYTPKKVKLAVGADVYHYNISITGSENDFIYDPESFEKHASSAVGATFQIIFNDFIKVQETISWYNFKSYTSYANYHPFSVAENYSQLEFQLSYLELQSTGRIDFSRKNFKPFLKAGLNVAQLISSSTDELTFERIGYSNPPKTFNFTKTQVAPIFGAGLAYQLTPKIEFGFNYSYLIHRFTIILSPGGSTDVNPNLALSQQQQRFGIHFLYHL